MMTSYGHLPMRRRWTVRRTLACAAIALAPIPIAVVAVAGADGGELALDSRVPERDLDVDTDDPTVPTEHEPGQAAPSVDAPEQPVPAAVDQGAEGESQSAAVQTTTTTAPPAPATTVAPPPVDWQAVGACLWNNADNARLAEWQTAGGVGYPADHPGEWASRAETLEQVWPGRAASLNC